MVSDKFQTSDQSYVHCTYCIWATLFVLIKEKCTEMMPKLTPPGLLICSSWCMTASSQGRFKNSKMMVNHLDKKSNSWCVEILRHPKLVKPFRMKHKLFVIDDHTTISPNLLTLGIHVFHLRNSVEYFTLPKKRNILPSPRKKKYFTLPKKRKNHPASLLRQLSSSVQWEERMQPES